MRNSKSVQKVGGGSIKIAEAILCLRSRQPERSSGMEPPAEKNHFVLFNFMLIQLNFFR